MKPTHLLERHSASWLAATRHPFLDAAREGTLAPRIFAAWLVQDYLFVTDEFAFQAYLLPRAPRSAQALLAGSLVALEAELSWFEEQAQRQKLSLEAVHHPVTAAYGTFLRKLEREPYPVAMTALWAIERAYLEAWASAAPGHPKYRQFIEHWANPAFAKFVAELERAATTALETERVDKEAEAVFLEVARLELDFWEMAWSGASL
ncbi:MAG: TenA family transcriptional regulator [Chloroflexi bacterium]|nr:TenA family transcriptional regulator [Chloroflexota bacterium]